MGEIKQTVAQIVTERLIASLEAGDLPPCRKPWNARLSHPANARSSKPYRGVNVWLLLMGNFVDPRWVTFKQALELGGSVRKGEHAMPIVFWKPADKKDEAKPKDERSGPILRFYRVFNVSQCDDLKIPELPAPGPTPDPIGAAEAIIEQMPLRPRMGWTGARAEYTPGLDLVSLPPRNRFNSPEAVYATAFHELAHSTGHATRLNRHQEDLLDTHFGSSSYGREELVAEMTAAFLCAEAGIEPLTIENQGAYLASWIKTIKGDPKMLITAGGQAQRAVDFILDRKVAEAVAA